MSAQLLVELLVLFTDRQVPIVSAPVVDAANRSSKAILGGLESDNPVPIFGACPIMGEAQEVKRTRTIVWWFIPIPPRRRKEAHKLRLGGVDGQTILAKSLWDDFHDTLSIALVAKPNHEVIRIADKECRPTHPRLHLLFEPLVQHIVQEYIRNQG
jgi:hypothetical protein